MRMGDNILDSFKIVNMEKECIVSPIWMFIWECGEMTSFMVKDCISMQMATDSKGNSRKGKSLEEESTNTRAVQSMMESGRRIERMDLESSIMQIKRNTKETG